MVVHRHSVAPDRSKDAARLSENRHSSANAQGRRVSAPQPPTQLMVQQKNNDQGVKGAQQSGKHAQTTTLSGNSKHPNNHQQANVYQQQSKDNYNSKAGTPSPERYRQLTTSSSSGALPNSMTTSTTKMAATSSSASTNQMPRKVLRSDSEPTIPAHSRKSSSGATTSPPLSPSGTTTILEDPFPASSAAARPSPRKSVDEGGSEKSGEAKPDWKERLRRFNALEGREKDSSSASSGSGQRQAAQRLARDFKDSDISSRHHNKGASSSNSSSGGPGKGVRKRMQTLYL